MALSVMIICLSRAMFFKNVPRLFTQGYAHQDRDFFSNTQDYGTGSVAYRPVLSLTYFLDRHVWGNNPFGLTVPQ